uniref:Uncharacterized protein n=1 Tax=Micrurus lemniscatus lemniscatus TaxID=129467 RepID=A0A2D4I6J7_MICLE
MPVRKPTTTLVQSPLNQSKREKKKSFLIRCNFLEVTLKSPLTRLDKKKMAAARCNVQNGKQQLRLGKEPAFDHPKVTRCSYGANTAWACTALLLNPARKLISC